MLSRSMGGEDPAKLREIVKAEFVDHGSQLLPRYEASHSIGSKHASLQTTGWPRPIASALVRQLHRRPDVDLA